MKDIPQAKEALSENKTSTQSGSKRPYTPRNHRVSRIDLTVYRASTDFHFLGDT